LNRDGIADLPSFDAFAKVCHCSGDFAARDSGQGDRDREPSFLKPEIKPIEPAGVHLNDHLAGSGHWVGQVAATEGPWLSVSRQLNRFHGAVFDARKTRFHKGIPGEDFSRSEAREGGEMLGSARLSSAGLGNRRR
jgi:hypothetical protein